MIEQSPLPEAVIDGGLDIESSTRLFIGEATVLCPCSASYNHGERISVSPNAPFCSASRRWQRTCSFLKWCAARWGFPGGLEALGLVIK